MLTRTLTVTVPGTPATKGSMKCVGRGTRHQLVDSNAGTKAWMQTLTAGIVEVWPPEQYAGAGQPITLTATFTFTRPAGHYGTGRNAAAVKASAPDFPTSRAVGDSDKLLRALADALQAAKVLDDDAQLVSVQAQKVYAEASGVRFTLSPVLSDGLPL